MAVFGAVGLLALTVAAMVGYGIIYAGLVNPGQSSAFYTQHFNAIARSVGVTVGVPVSFGLGWYGGRGQARGSALANAALLTACFAALDIGLIYGVSATPRLDWRELGLSYFSKFAAAATGGVAAVVQTAGGSDLLRAKAAPSASPPPGSVDR